jgi:acyl-CoA thioesterase FadM
LQFEVARSTEPEVVVAKGQYILVCVRRGEFRAVPVPDAVREKLAPYLENG